jgi:two-component system nitrate/nitrite sensor histidine kinase NarX
MGTFPLTDGSAMGSSDLRRLKWLGVALPIVFIVLLEAFRYAFIEEDQEHWAEHVALGAITIVAVLGFALLMFYLIEHAQRQIVRQNRELAAVNAVSTAVQGELAVEQIIDAALTSVVETTGATEASVTVFAPEGHREDGIERSVRVASHASPLPGLGSDVPHLIDIPLSTGTSIVGRMRLHLPEGVAEPDLLASATLQNIGHQLASSIQIGQLVGDLQRRRLEGHGLLDVLLRISNQGPLVETLSAVVRHAQDLLHADDSVMCLVGATAQAVQLDDSYAGMLSLVDGTLCIVAEPDRFHDVHGRPAACPIRTARDIRTDLEVALSSPEGTLGDLWVGRRSGQPYTERDRGFLLTLAGLASIAVTNARMRENERQGAILAERERIAREMHDSLAQVLGVTHLRLRALGSRPAVIDAPAIATEIAELADISEEAYRDVREAILGLRESSRTDRGLLEGLRAYLEKYSHQSGVKATLETTLDEEPTLSPRSEVQLIRVIQEALTNVRKHAGASTAIVRITNGTATTSIAIEDDGHGFDLTGTLLDRDSGFGLHTMRERMELIGGTLSIDSAPGRGTRVIARIPGVPHAASVPLEVDGAPNGSDSDLARR